MSACSAKRSKSMFGGYASHVVIPDPKFLIDTTGALPRGLGSVYMCSGLTAFSALKKVGTPPNGACVLATRGGGGRGQQWGGAAALRCPPLPPPWPLRAARRGLGDTAAAALPLCRCRCFRRGRRRGH
jgi:hypothetical protein